MSGHSKWHNIKGKKQAEDAKRGKLFTKLGKEIVVAAKEGGGNIDSNPRLRSAIEKAKAGGMPLDNIERAIKRGTGELKDGVTIEELTYEGYGPNGVALMVEVTTDNKNRTSAEIRKVFSKFGGSMGEQGCVSWMFTPTGRIVLGEEVTDEEKAFEYGSMVNANDIQQEDDRFVLLVDPKDLYVSKEELDKNKIKVESAELVKIPSTWVTLEGDKAQQLLKLVNELDDHDDVDEVFGNYDVSDEEMEKFYGSN
jgi:YebC/PmpR family DNA-binding regulatory protein